MSAGPASMPPSAARRLPRVVPYGDLAVLALLGDAATAERHAAAAAEALALAAERLATAPGA